MGGMGREGGARAKPGSQLVTLYTCVPNVSDFFHKSDERDNSGFG